MHFFRYKQGYKEIKQVIKYISNITKLASSQFLTVKFHRYTLGIKYKSIQR